MPKVDAPGQSGLNQAPLNEDEQNKLTRYYNRGLQDVRSLDTRVLLNAIRKYQDEVMTAAKVAKANYEAEFDGQQPQSGSFGVSRIRAGFFGYDSWDNCPDAVSGETTTWLDNATPDNLGGAGGVNNPLTVGEPVVHLIVGVASNEQSPKAESVKFRLNDQPRTAIQTGYEFRNTDTRIKLLETPILLREDDDLYAEYYADADGAESLYPVGLTFIQAKDQRELDPAQMAGTDSDNIVVE